MDNLDSLKPSISDFKILLAEDTLVNQKVAKRVLTHLGYEADIVSNGLEAIRAIADKSYDLILMDIQMPEMSDYIGKPIQIDKLKSTLQRYAALKTKK